MKYFTCFLLLFSTTVLAQANCQYVNNISFTGMYAQLVNRGPDMLGVYGLVQNNSDDAHTLTSVASPLTRNGTFNIYPQNTTGDVTSTPIDSITLSPQGGLYTWERGGNHIEVNGFKKAKNRPQFGTDFDPNQTISLIFTFSDGCTVMLDSVPVKDRMQE
jgi:copper(I)-binding protein